MVGKMINSLLNIRRNNKILSFIIIFIFVFGFLIISNQILIGIFTQPVIEPVKSVIKSNLIKGRQVSYNMKNPVTLIISNVYYDKPNPDNSFPQKQIEINIFNEIYLPFIFWLSLTLAIPFRMTKLFRTFSIGLILIYLYLFFKIFAIIVDNYNYPDFIIVNMNGLVDNMVYYFNFFLNKTGASTNAILPLIIWLLSLIDKNTPELLSSKFDRMINK